MSRPVFADPKTDFVFKRIFGTEEHKDVLLAFLNDLLELDAAHRITSVELLSPEQRPKVDEMKLSIVDVLCVDARGTRYVVEMQVLNVEAFEKRVVYNVAKTYTNQLEKGRRYPELNDVIGITICDFELWPRTSGGSATSDGSGPAVPMLSRWSMTEHHTGARGLQQIQFVFLELPKLVASRPPETIVEKWAYFFSEAENLEVAPEVLAEPQFVKALDAARTAGFTVEEWDLYIRAGMAIQDERGALSVARNEGKQEGKQEGLAEGKREGLAEGKREGLLDGIEAACDLLGIEISGARRREIDGLDVAGLKALLAKIRAEKRWS